MLILYISLDQIRKRTGVGQFIIAHTTGTCSDQAPVTRNSIHGGRELGQRCDQSPSLYRHSTLQYTTVQLLLSQISKHRYRAQYPSVQRLTGFTVIYPYFIGVKRVPYAPALE